MKTDMKQVIFVCTRSDYTVTNRALMTLDVGFCFHFFNKTKENQTSCIAPTQVIDRHSLNQIRST
jgi:hypothetical protein